MNDEMDDAIEVLLREQFEGPVADNDFCESVMDRLPARQYRKKWPMAVGAVAGVAMCWFSLWSAPIIYVGWQDWLSGEMSAYAIMLFISMMSMAIVALIWTISEAEDRYDLWRTI